MGKLFRILAAAAIGSMGVAAFAQNAPAAGGASLLDVVVTPAAGALKPDDFTVLDNGTPVTVRAVHSEANGAKPSRVVLVVDDMNVWAQELLNEHQEVQRFLRSSGTLPALTKLGVVTSGGLQLGRSFATDGRGLADELDELGPKLSTNAQPSLDNEVERATRSLNALMQLVSRIDPAFHTAIFWVSPGWPLVNRPDYEVRPEDERRLFAEVEKATNLMRDHRVTLYALNPLGSGESLQHAKDYDIFVKPRQKAAGTTFGHLGLQVLALQSGGRVDSSNDVGTMLRQDYAELSHEYEIAVDLPATSGKSPYHSLDVRLHALGWTARARRGYYADPAINSASAH